MAKHSCKELDDLLDRAEKADFRIERAGGLIKVFPPDKALPFYSGHMGERGFHPIRRYLKNTCKIGV